MNLALHQDRVNRCFLEHQISAFLNIKEIIKSHHIPEQGIYKLRISYNVFNSIETKILIHAYIEKPIDTLQIVHMDKMEYKHKSEDRKQLDKAYAQRKLCDDVIIVQDGKLTDTWYCNIAFWDSEKWITPESPLLKGTMRKKLIHNKTIRAENVSISDLHKFKKARLFNALIPWSNKKEIDISNIYL